MPSFMQNVTFSVVIKLVFLVLAVTGYASLWLAILADVGAMLCVTFNGMTVLSTFAPPHDEKSACIRTDGNQKTKTNPTVGYGSIDGADATMSSKKSKAKKGKDLKDLKEPLLPVFPNPTKTAAEVEKVDDCKTG
jgi:hypothetical protein